MSYKNNILSRGVIFALVLMAAVFAPAVSHAASYSVNSFADAVDNNIGDGVCLTAAGVCSLRAAIQEANASVGTPDTVSLPAGTYVLSISGADNTAVAGDLDLVGPAANTIIINGAGAATTIIDGNGIAGVNDRIFETVGGAVATISGVTIMDGNSGAGSGGCISVGNGTTLNLNNSVVTACATGALGEGGGIESSGTLNMNTVSVTNNTSDGGGGMNIGVGGTLAWTNGTLSGNSDRAINNSGTITLTNITISGNTTAGNGAGLDNGGTATLINATISGNTSTTALNIGGVRNDNTLSVRNSIISNNTPVNCGGANPLNSQGNNLDSEATCLTVLGGGDVVNTDPLLLALADNGGSVQTLALQPTSPAIDTAPTTTVTCPGTDARGVTRPVDGDSNGTLICDKGAFEFRPRKLSTSTASINFGTVTSGTTSDQILTITNAGDGDLTLGVIAAADGLAAPFSIAAKTCVDNQVLARAASCTVTVRFSPTTTASLSDTFSIPSDDPANPTVTFSVSGLGSSTIAANISITPSTTVDFGSVTVGTTVDATLTVTAGGSAALVIGTIGAPAAPFEITSNTCSGQTIPSASSCALTIRFSPTSNAASVDSFDIPNNDPDTPTITISLKGSGVAPSGNNPPSAPVLVSPDDGATLSGTSVTLVWQRSTDADGDTVTYQVTNCANQDFTGCAPVDVASASAAGLALAGLGSLGGIIMIGFVAGSGSRRSRKALLMLAAVLLTGSVFLSCSSGGGGDAPPAPPQHTVTGLTPGTYYWKVAAIDGNGGVSTSEPRSYTLQP